MLVHIGVLFYAQESDYCPLSGAVSLCNPFNLVIADEDFHKGFNNVYDKALASSLCKIFKKYSLFIFVYVKNLGSVKFMDLICCLMIYGSHALLFEDIGEDYNISLAANAKTVREFDEGLTRGKYSRYQVFCSFFL